MTQDDKLRALRWSFYGISSVMLVEFLGGFLANSLAVISDAAHASLDAITTFWLLYATRLSLKPPDANHTYGHEKIETIGGQLGGIALIGIAALLFYYSIARLLEGSAMARELTSIALLAVIYTLGVDVFRMKILSGIRDYSPSAKADFFHAVADFSSTVTALFGVAASSLGFGAGDALSSLALSGFLAFLSARLVYKTSLELSDISSARDYQIVQSLLHNIGGVTGFKSLRMRKVGSKHYVDVTILLSSSIDMEKAHSIASLVEEKIKHAVGRATVTIHCEPVAEELPFEKEIDRIAMRDERVKGVHGISWTKTSEGTFLTLHIETDPSLTLSEAHKISERIEDSIERTFPDIKETTVHMEGYPETDSGRIVHGKRDLQKIRQILSSNPNIRKITSIRVSESDKAKRVDITCSFIGKDSIEKIHREISMIESEVKKSIGECNVTIHAEPV